MDRCILRDRAIIAVFGEDAEGLLNRLFTNSMLGMESGTARYAALLSPQGKLLFDFFVYGHAGGFWIDGMRDQAAELTKKLVMFKLRANVVITQAVDLVVAARWGRAPSTDAGSAFRDPRHAQLGDRIVGQREALEAFGEDADAYEAHRIALGVPKGGVDFAYGNAFVHDANLDLLHGVDFNKGCYVGQEVVSRVHHRNSARKRIVKVHFHGDAPSIGAALAAGSSQIGQVTSIRGHDGLAAVRTDRLAEAQAARAPVLAGETLVTITLPADGDAPSPQPVDHVA